MRAVHPDQEYAQSLFEESQALKAQWETEKAAGDQKAARDTYDLMLARLAQMCDLILADRTTAP